MPHSTTIERSKAVPSPALRLAAQIVAVPSGGWRFPAEFRQRPTGWTARPRPAEPSLAGQPDSNTVESRDSFQAHPPCMLLDAGLGEGPGPAPELAPDNAPASNGPAPAYARPLAYGQAALRQMAPSPSSGPAPSATIGQRSPVAALALDRGALDRGADDHTAWPCVCEHPAPCSNGSAPFARRDIGDLSRQPKPVSTAPFSALCIGGGTAGQHNRPLQAALYPSSIV